MKTRLAVVMLIAGVIAVYLLRVDDAAGLYKDDAYYLVLAKALAQGDGYRLISSAATPIVPAVPPLYPLLIAPVFAIGEAFPGNLFWIKLVSILAMLATGALTFRYYYRYRALDARTAAAIAFLTALTPGLVFLATSTTMPECVFVCAVLAAACAVERAARETASWRGIASAALLSTAAMLVRSAGVAMIAAGAMVLLRRRGWRTATVFLLVSLAAYSPWLIYSVAYAPARAEREAHGGAFVYGYRDLLQSASGGGVGESQPRIGIGDVPRRLANNAASILLHDAGALIFPAGYRGFDESGLEVFMLSAAGGLDAGSMGLGWGAVALSIPVTAIVLVGAFALGRRGYGVAEWFCLLTIAIVLMVPSRTYRYVLPLAPFAFAYFLIGVRELASRIRASAGAAALRIAAACLAAFLIAEHVAYIWQRLSGSPPWLRDHDEIARVADFVRDELPHGPMVSTNPALLYLLTGRQAVAYVEPLGSNWHRWRSAGIGYAVAFHDVPKPGPSLGYRPIYESPRLKLWVVQIAAP